jgi:hypothetical protein
VNSGAFDLNIGSNTLYQAQKAAYHPNAVFLEEYCPRAFAGEIVTRNLRVYNDRLVSGNLVLQWRAGAGAWQTRSFTMTPADRRRETVTFAAPAAPGPFALQIRVTEGANTLFSNNVACAALARPALVRPPGVNLGLYDPGGAVAALLARFNLPFVAVTNLGADSYSQFNLLVVGRNALGEAPTLEAGRLTIAAKWQDFMLRGGWVLVLDQTNYPAWMPYELRLGGFDASHAFPNAAHPLMQGLTSEDLRWWTGDHRVVSNVLVMPARGSFRPLASIGSKLGLEYAAAVELPVGPGGLLCAQWLVTTRFDLEPLAGVLFQRMLDYPDGSASRVAPGGIGRGLQFARRQQTHRVGPAFREPLGPADEL